MKKEKSCGALVYHTDSKGQVTYLLIQHKNGGHWAFTKGHVEGQESEAETALREIQEEVQLQVDLDQGFRHLTTYSPKPGVTKDVIYFVAQSQSQTVKTQTDEVLAYAWLPFDQALAQLSYPNDQAILSAAHDYLSKK